MERPAKLNRIGLIAGLVLFVAFAVHFINYAPDDVWISLRYAENLAGGNGLTFNPGQRVEGYSNFLWVLLIAIPAPALSPDALTLAAKIIGILAGFFALLVIGWTARYLPLTDHSYAAWGAAAFAYGLYGYPAFWSATGMETGLYTLLVAAACCAYLAFRKHPTALRGALAALVFTAVALTRPEGVIFFFAAAMVEGAKVWHNRKIQTPAVVFAGLFVVFYANFLLWRHAYFGHWLPNTYYAKAGGGFAQLAEGARYLMLTVPALFWSSPVLLLVFLLPFIPGRRVGGAVAFVGLCVAGQAAFVVYVGGDWMPGARFLVPAMPAVALLVPVVIGQIARRRKQAGHQPLGALARTLLLLAATMLCLGHLYNAKQVRHDPSGFTVYDGARYFKHDHFAVAQWLAKNGRSTDLVALGEAGLIPYLTGMPALDLFGLMDPYLARLPGLRHKKFDPNYVFEKRPRFVVLGGCKMWNDAITSDFQYARVLLKDPRLEARYERVLTHHTFLVYRANDVAP